MTVQLNYEHFVLELTRLARKYGVAVKSVSGVLVIVDPEEFRDVSCVGDIGSGDLLPCRVEALE